MKLPALLATLAFLPLLLLEAAPPAPPAIPIEQALKLATDHLAERGLTGQHFISSLTLEDSALTGGERFWLARWVPVIKANDREESGLQIRMDGSVARQLSGGPRGVRSDVAGQRRVGARSMR
jgi:hypothetical protein